LLPSLCPSLWLLLPGTAITRENFARIQEGMTLKDVEEILGGPARDESTGPTQFERPLPAELGDQARHPDSPSQIFGYDADIEVFDQNAQLVEFSKEWKSDRVAILLYFDATERLTSKHERRLCPVEVSLVTRLRRWLGL
jgi:hypothetical protein